MTLRRPLLLPLLFSFVVVLLAVLGPELAGAATYSTSCPALDDSCAALAERLETLQDSSEVVAGKLDVLHDDLSGAGPAEVSGTVALSAADRDRADLAWWGTWAAVGLLLVLIAPYFLSVSGRPTVLDDGFQVAAGFFALGLLWLFIALFLLGAVDWVRRLLGVTKCIACNQIKPEQFGPNYARALWVPARPSVQTGEPRPTTVAETESK